MKKINQTVTCPHTCFTQSNSFLEQNTGCGDGIGRISRMSGFPFLPLHSVYWDCCFGRRGWRESTCVVGKGDLVAPKVCGTHFENWFSGLSQGLCNPTGSAPAGSYQVGTAQRPDTNFVWKGFPGSCYKSHDTFVCFYYFKKYFSRTACSFSKVQGWLGFIHHKTSQLGEGTIHSGKGS